MQNEGPKGRSHVIRWLTELREPFPMNRWGRSVNEAADELLQESARQVGEDVPVFRKKKR